MQTIVLLEVVLPPMALLVYGGMSWLKGSP